MNWVREGSPLKTTGTSNQLIWRQRDRGAKVRAGWGGRDMQEHKEIHSVFNVHLGVSSPTTCLESALFASPEAKARQKLRVKP